jgi:SAM-dependent methyltransferase
MFIAMSDFKYVGAELDLFAAVHNWKSYWSRRIRPFIAGDVVEVGAGIGSNTMFLDTAGSGRWVALEPDAELIAQLRSNLTGTGNGREREAVCGTLRSLGGGDAFDTIVYIDVLEHIEDDRGELREASSRLRPGGRIIVLSPAHQRLFTPFDAAIGHFRRYNRRMLRGISPPGLRVESMFYLDSAGLLLSAANLLLLRQSMPTKAQLHVWDTWVIPVSRMLDPCLFRRVGKSIVAVWRKESAETR